MAAGITPFESGVRQESDRICDLANQYGFKQVQNLRARGIVWEMWPEDVSEDDRVLAEGMYDWTLAESPEHQAVNVTRNDAANFILAIHNYIDLLQGEK
jgi:hypothetical protein